MSDAAAAAAAEAPPKKSKKKLIVMLAAVLVLTGGGGGGFFYMKQKAAAAAAAAAEEDGEESAAVNGTHKDAHKDAKTKPTYVPLEAFVVNLSDKESDRFAQIGITLQVDDSKVADDMKTYMPTLRNGILMILAHKSSEELLQRDGKETLAQEIMLAAARALGIEVDDPEAEASHGKGAKAAAHASDDEDEDQPKKPKKNKKKKKKKTVHNPITHVHFSNFIIQ
jgi:flagellar protein FliL